MVRKWVDEDGDIRIDVDCRCGGDMLRISSLLDDDSFDVFYLSFWSYVGAYPTGFWNRLRAAWRMFRYARGYNEVVMEAPQIQELITALQGTLAEREAQRTAIQGETASA